MLWKNHIDRASQPHVKRQGAGRGSRFRDMEVLFTAEPGQTLTIDITTSVDNSRGRWEALFNRLQTVSSLPAGKLTIHDFGATPGVARIRIEQVFEG